MTQCMVCYPGKGNMFVSHIILAGPQSRKAESPFPEPLPCRCLPLLRKFKERVLRKKLWATMLNYAHRKRKMLSALYKCPLKASVCEAMIEMTTSSPIRL